MDLEQLRATIDTLVRAPYLLTVSDDERCRLGGRGLRVARRRDRLPWWSRTLQVRRPEAGLMVSLLWAPNDADGYSLIVDATVTATAGTGTGDNVVRLRPNVRRAAPPRTRRRGTRHRLRCRLRAAVARGGRLTKEPELDQTITIVRPVVRGSAMASIAAGRSSKPTTWPTTGRTAPAQRRARRSRA